VLSTMRRSPLPESATGALQRAMPGVTSPTHCVTRAKRAPERTARHNPAPLAAHTAPHHKEHCMHAVVHPRSPPTHGVGAPPSTGARQRRFLAAADRPAVDLAARTVALSFSSELPVERWFGNEVLSHEPGAADLTRLNRGAPLLFNHDTSDIIGVVESATIGTDRKGRAIVRFGKDARGDWALGQVADGILRNVSLTYSVHDYAEGADDDTFIARSWQAYEISLVSVPADPSVGIGRSLDPTPRRTTVETDNIPATEAPQSRRSRAATSGAIEDERLRAASIAAVCQRWGRPELAQRYIDEGASVQSVRVALDTRPVQQPVGAPPPDGGWDFNAGFSVRDIDNFSITRAIGAVMTGNWQHAGLERAVSKELEQMIGRRTAGILVPSELLQTRAPYFTGASATGGAVVATNLMADSFVEPLRNVPVVQQAGATMLGGLVGAVDIPRQTTQTAAYWVPESGAITEAEATFDKIQLRPRTLGALSKMSRLMLMQSTPAIEMLVRNDLGRVLALGVDLAALSGSGAGNQPTGIVNQGGISTLALGPNGAAVDLDALVNLEQLLNSANAPPDARAYIVNSKTAASMKRLKSSTGQYLWSDGGLGQRSGTPATFNGYPVLISNQARSNLTKGTSNGVCSEIFFGSWSELVIGEWGVTEILVNPYDTTGFASGDVLIRAMQTMDIAVRHGASFAVISDALTT